MKSRFRKSNPLKKCVSAVMLLLLTTGAFAFGVPPKVSRLTTIVDGIHSPRGLAFGPGNILYVAQAGDESHAGSILQIRNSMSQNADARTLAGGFPTFTDEGETLGVSGISVLGRGVNAGVYAIVGLAPQNTGDSGAGSLFNVSLKGNVQTLANVGSSDFIWTGDHANLWEEFPDSNPYGVLAIPGHVYIANAGANTLDEVLPDGTVEVLAYFPNEVIRDAIPTCVTQGPDGALYIGTLAFVDSAVLGPSAKVYRVDPSQANLNDPTATPMTQWAHGLWPINGCTFGPDGNFYASELYTNPAWFFGTSPDAHGDVVRIPFSSPTTHTSLTNGGLAEAGGVAVSPDGDVFVADGTISPEGRVVRINR